MSILQGEAAKEQIDRLRFLRAKRSICALGEVTVPKYCASWHHKVKSRYLEQVIKYARFAGKQGGISRLLLSEPPQHGKSLHAGELAPALALGQDPDLTVMATAYNSSLAGERAENTKAIMKTEGYMRTFPTRVGTQYDPNTGRAVQTKDQSNYFKTLRENSDGSFAPARGHFYAAGISAGLTGRGFKLGILDDWVKDEQAAMSPASTLHRIGTYTKGFESRQQGVCGVIAIGTMWDCPDWLDWLWDLWTDQGHDPVWLRFPALSDDTAIYPLHEDDPRTEGSEESLWEERFPAAEQRKKRNGLIVKDPNSWLAIQQQAPKRISGSLFPKTAWQHFAVTGDHAFSLSQLDEIHMSIDGNAKDTGASFAVLGVYGVMVRSVADPLAPGKKCTTKHYFRLDESRGHYDFALLRDETLRLWNKWRGAFPELVARGRCWVEDKANGTPLMSQLAGRGIAFTAVPKIRSKIVCHRMAQLAVLEGRCWLPLDSDGLVTHGWVRGIDGDQGFVRELAAQPKEPDDRADEFSQFIICNDPHLGIELLALR